MPIVKYVIPIESQGSANEELYWLSVIKYHWFYQVEHELKAIRVNNWIAQVWIPLLTNLCLSVTVIMPGTGTSF